MTKNLPYEMTTVSIERSIKQINDLLYKYDVTKISWGSEKDKFFILIFAIPKENGRFIPIRIKMDLLYKQTRNGTKPLPEATYRMAFYYIKSKLEAVRFGLESMEETFMPNIIIDSNRTFKDIAFKQLPKYDPKMLHE